MKMFWLVIVLFCCGLSFYGGHQLAYDHSIYNADAILLGVFKVEMAHVLMFNTYMVEDKYKFFEHIYNEIRIRFDWNLDEVADETGVMENTFSDNIGV